MILGLQHNYINQFNQEFVSLEVAVFWPDIEHILLFRIGLLKGFRGY